MPIRVDLEAAILSNGVLICLQLKRFDEAMGLALRKLAIMSDEDEKEEAKSWIDRVNKAIDELDEDAKDSR